jgi:rare lipoprotein A
LKIGRFILVASSSLAFLGAAHAQGGRGNAGILQAFSDDIAALAHSHAPGEPTAPRATGGQIVRASWYGGGERLNRRTSTGEIFHPMGHTAAHRTLPLGTMLRVSALATGLSTIVRVNDRGPAAYTGRALDLSRGAALALGIVGTGDSRVAIEVLR